MVGLTALGSFGFRLADEPSFVDEWAYVSQSYYFDRSLHPDNPAWLDYPALDLPPLTKHLVGFSLKASGYRLPTPVAAWAWYADDHSTFGPPEMLNAARRPIVVFGAVGCVAIFAIGTLAADVWVGLLAAILLMIDPLYRMLARRAMADIPAEAFILMTVALGLWSWRGVLSGRWGWARGLAGFLAAGIMAGLATLSKLNGVLGLFILAAWMPLAAWRGRRLMTILVGWGLAVMVAFGTFAALNPFLTARPKGPLPPEIAALAHETFWQRTRTLVEHRLRSASGTAGPVSAQCAADAGREAEGDGCAGLRAVRRLGREAIRP